MNCSVYLVSHLRHMCSGLLLNYFAFIPLLYWNKCIFIIFILKLMKIWTLMVFSLILSENRRSSCCTRGKSVKWKRDKIYLHIFIIEYHCSMLPAHALCFCTFFQFFYPHTVYFRQELNTEWRHNGEEFKFVCDFK